MGFDYRVVLSNAEEVWVIALSEEDVRNIVARFFPGLFPLSIKETAYWA